MLVRARQPWGAAPTGPPARARRVKHSEGGAPGAPQGGLRGHRQSRHSSLTRRRGLLHKEAGGTSGPVAWAPRGSPTAPTPSARVFFLPAHSLARRVRSCPGSPSSQLSHRAHTRRPPYGGQLLTSLTPGLSPPPGTPLQAWPPPHPPLASSRWGTLSALSPGCLRGLGAWDHDPHPHPAAWPATCRGAL